jgi:replicative DNA helicase
VSALAVVEQQPIANVEAEASLCGALMQENRLIDQIADKLSAEDFSEALHGRIFQAILSEHSKGRAANVITLRPYFTDDPAMNDVGGIGYLAQLTGSGVAVIGAKDFARQIRELAQRRRLIDGFREVIAEAHKPETELADLVSAAEEALTGASSENATTQPLDAHDCISQALEYDGYGVRSGILAIDDTIGQLALKDLTIGAGRPGMCKTGTALSYGIGAAQRGHGVLFVSLEMSGLQLGARMAADWCFDRGDKQVPFDAITTGRLTTEQGRAVAKAAEAMRDLPLTIEDVSGLTVASLDRMVRRHARRFTARGRKLELVIVDYLQLLGADRQSDNRTAEITQISMALKRCAKANNVALFALSQLSRAVEQRPDKRPRLSDLRESGSIEQDADNVMFLFRPEYYVDQEEPPADDPNRMKWEQAKAEVAGRLEFICGKRRQGRTGIGRGTFYGQFQAVRG